MTDPKEELGERFNDRRADSRDSDSDESSDDEAGTNMSHSDTTDNTDSTGTTDNSYNTGNSSTTDNTSKPGPNPDPDSTRNRRQLAMYLPETKADQLNNLYDRLDGQSKIAGDGGIEKHADFMEALVEFAVDHEGELADRLGIEK
ncbi:hypothetical protein EXE46_05900 [Halorubrum sp. GN11_10-6_MGM]|uniref:hypothetical protein n=1 Tax=Halorubrum sp. GN11_10-6_MGM TaxID=2518112 RepID=UPI0010F5C5B6|nr:hypothetical protein [Halorubrum sp. GN11_10-6_MGM]TKX74945.1 hypothetical protein EXE46_05900 [Halorubrum sp. GN11_10-6_MGM]